MKEGKTMPFVQTGSGVSIGISWDEDGSNPTSTSDRTVGIDISDVDRERERLSITMSDKDSTLTFRFMLVDDGSGNDRLQLDPENTDQKIIDHLDELVITQLGSAAGDPWIACLYQVEEKSDLFWTADPLALVVTCGDSTGDFELDSDDPDVPEEIEMRIETFTVTD